MTPSDTTFVIASRNRATELAVVVGRLLDTTACPIVVVDNASEDHSVALMRRLATRSAHRLRLIELDTNRGAVGRNFGVAACTTPYVAFSDDDSWWTPESPAIGAELFDRHPSVGLLAARTIVWPQRCEDPFAGLLADSALGRRDDLPGPSVLGFMSCAAMVRVSAFQQAGGFSDILHFRGEEQLLAWDLAASGWDLCYCPQLTAIHQPSQVRATTAAQDARVLRNSVLTTWLRRPIAQCLGATRHLLRGAIRDREHARGAAEAILKLPAVLRQRRRLPASVEDAVSTLEAQ
ncbi:glycosyltransferase family 2 protein [Mycolicibacterium elephantis]|uniref:glycosyltransferase family 2 protein n=1 Tax=Mycolicibacterium elephantis TaxID=81858 RepID=UPI00062984B1|nr:glycosyltransferase family 2 protein [Mycolicibacterium elephantis]KKW64290.1 transferase [Mycolicibacterium elephantis]OBB17435.1 transferase [Mycolicibacterium elephantis]OBE95784.1 transferase [Mycolicibacterium elephantis]